MHISGYSLLLGIGIGLMASAARADPPPRGEPHGEGEGGHEKGMLFPDWPPDRFDLNLGPVLGGRTRSTEVSGVKYDTLSSEIGLAAQVRGIPIIPGNPGFLLEPYGTYTWGNRTEKQKGTSLDHTDSSGFQRHWLGLVGKFYYHSFRYTLDYGQGKITYDDDKFIDLNATRISNDFALLILPFLSTHYTLTSYSVTEDQETSPSIQELDHWIHERMAFSLLNFSLDLGPGRSHTKYAGRADALSPFQTIGTVDTTYLKALSSLHLFWKLGASGYVKYIVDANQIDSVTNLIEQLPNQGLSDNKTLANLPKGSMEASAFIGFHRLFSGFGIGWQTYYLEIANDKTGKQISRDQGIVVNYSGSL